MRRRFFFGLVLAAPFLATVAAARQWQPRRGDVVTYGRQQNWPDQVGIVTCVWPDMLLLDDHSGVPTSRVRWTGANATLPDSRRPDFKALLQPIRRRQMRRFAPLCRPAPVAS